MRLEIWREEIGVSVFAQRYALVVVHASVVLDWNHSLLFDIRP